MKITITAISEIQRARFYILKKQKKSWNSYIYIKPDIFQKSKTIPFTFCIKKSGHFMLHDFSWNFWSWHLYTKCMKFCVTWRFYIQKSRHFEISKTICVTFLHTKIMTLCVMQFFIEFLRLGGWGERHYYVQKTLHFVLQFYLIKKQYTLR